MGVQVHECTGASVHGGGSAWMQGQASLWSLAGMSKSHQLGASHASQKRSDVNGLRYFAWAQYGHLQLHACSRNRDECWKGRGWSCKDARHAASSQCMGKS